MKIEPCPCCGNKNLYSGATSCNSQGVICWPHGGGCGLTMSVSYPNFTKLGVKEMEAKTLAKAISRWNKRTKS